MAIAIVSDTHMPRGRRRLPRAWVARLRDAELIVHAGDLASLSVLRELDTMGVARVGRGEVSFELIVLD